MRTLYVLANRNRSLTPAEQARERAGENRRAGRGSLVHSRAVRGTLVLRGVAAAALAAAMLAAGCGGGERQDANEPAGTYPVQVVKKDFASDQHVSRGEWMTIAVKNNGQKAIPDLAVTVDSFSAADEQAGLADAQRPVWVVDKQPAGSPTAYVNTWSLGRALAAGRTATFRWRVVPTQSGTHKVSYKVAAGLDGRARAEQDGQIPAGSWTVNISDAPVPAHVADDGKTVVREGD
jgi:hypothetical protein